MVDPVNFTNFKLKKNGLEEYILFCIAVAGKNAASTAKILNKLIHNKTSPFKQILAFKSENNLRQKMQELGFGCYTLKAKGFWYISNSKLNLKTCTVEDLEQCPGIGMKTSRFFTMHTREQCNVACLDTHVLSYLRDRGFEASKSTPQSKKQYLRLENIFLKILSRSNMTSSELDLAIWRVYSGHGSQDNKEATLSFLRSI